MDAAPIVTPRSVAICGRIESATRTMAWLAKPATASRTMARVCEGMGRLGEGASTRSRSLVGALYRRRACAHPPCRARSHTIDAYETLALNQIAATFMGGTLRA